MYNSGTSIPGWESLMETHLLTRGLSLMSLYLPLLVIKVYYICTLTLLVGMQLYLCSYLLV